jgi:hypothetical protein
MIKMIVEIECNENLEDGILELILTDFDPEYETGFNMKDFFNAVMDNLSEDYNVNGYNYEYLFIDTYSNIYDGASACNCWVSNAIIDLYENGRAVLHAVDPEDIEDIKNDWFN